MAIDLPVHPTHPSTNLLAETPDQGLDGFDASAPGAIAELSDEDLDAVSGGRHHHGHNGRHHGRHHGHQSSHADFHKHSLTMSGQTITAADGSSVTSFTIKEEDITSHSDQSIG
jgi:hypothetical protein